MESKTHKEKKNKETVKEEIYDCRQIATILRMDKYSREVPKIKYPDKKLTEKEWKGLLEKDGFNF